MVLTFLNRGYIYSSFFSLNSDGTVATYLLRCKCVCILHLLFVFVFRYLLTPLYGLCLIVDWLLVFSYVYVEEKPLYVPGALLRRSRPHCPPIFCLSVGRAGRAWKSVRLACFLAGLLVHSSIYLEVILFIHGKCC